MVSYKKAISPVVATALLLVVAVVAVVGFQSWFATYQSGINTQVEQESSTGSAVTIERLGSGSNADVYVKVNSDDAINVSVSVPGQTNCNGTIEFSADEAPGVKSTTMSSCSLVKGTDYVVVAVGPSGVYQETEIAR